MDNLLRDKITETITKHYSDELSDKICELFFSLNRIESNYIDTIDCILNNNVLHIKSKLLRQATNEKKFKEQFNSLKSYKEVKIPSGSVNGSSVVCDYVSKTDALELLVNHIVEEAVQKIVNKIREVKKD